MQINLCQILPHGPRRPHSGGAGKGGPGKGGGRTGAGAGPGKGGSAGPGYTGSMTRGMGWWQPQ